MKNSTTPNVGQGLRDLYKYAKLEDIPAKIKNAMDCMTKSYGHEEKNGFRNSRKLGITEYIYFMEDMHQCFLEMLDLPASEGNRTKTLRLLDFIRGEGGIQSVIDTTRESGSILINYMNESNWLDCKNGYRLFRELESLFQYIKYGY